MAATPILSEPFNGQSFFIQSNDGQHPADRPRTVPGFIAVGVITGLAGALAASSLLWSMLFQVSPVDPLNVAGVCALLLVAVAAVAGYLSTRRAARIDPVETLRGNGERRFWRRSYQTCFSHRASPIHGYWHEILASSGFAWCQRIGERS